MIKGSSSYGVMAIYETQLACPADHLPKRQLSHSLKSQFSRHRQIKPAEPISVPQPEHRCCRPPEPAASLLTSALKSCPLVHLF